MNIPWGYHEIPPANIPSDTPNPGGHGRTAMAVNGLLKCEKCLSHRGFLHALRTAMDADGGGRSWSVLSMNWKTLGQLRTVKAFVEGSVFADAVAACERAPSTTPFKWTGGKLTAVIGVSSVKL